MTEDFESYRLLILDRLDRQSESIDKLTEETGRFRVQVTEQIATLKVKAGFWGAIAGAIPSAVAASLWLFGKR